MDSSRPNGINSNISPPKADFNGSGRNMAARANILIHEMDEYFEAAELTNKVKMKYIFSRALSGVAKKWYDQHIRLDEEYGEKEYEQIKKTFLEHFARDNAFQKESSKDKFFKLTQTREVQSFADALSTIAMEIPSYSTNNELLIDKFISGLNPKVRHHMHAVPDGSHFEKYLDAAREAEKFLKSDPAYLAELSAMQGNNKRRRGNYGNNNQYHNQGTSRNGYPNNDNSGRYNNNYQANQRGYFGRGSYRGPGYGRRGYGGSRRGQNYRGNYHQNGQRNFSYYGSPPPQTGTNQQGYAQGHLQRIEAQDAPIDNSEDVDMEQENNLNAESQ